MKTAVIASVFTCLIGALAAPVVNREVQQTEGLLDPVEGIVKGLPLLGGLLDGLLHPVIGTLNGVTDKLPIGGLTKGLGDTLGGVVDTVGNTVKGVPVVGGTLNGVTSTLGNTVKGATGALDGAVDGVTDAASGVAKGI